MKTLFLLSTIILSVSASLSAFAYVRNDETIQLAKEVSSLVSTCVAKLEAVPAKTIKVELLAIRNLFWTIGADTSEFYESTPYLAKEILDLTKSDGERLDQVQEKKVRVSLLEIKHILWVNGCGK